MRRLAVIGIVSALTAAGGALAAGSGPSGGSVRPSLRLVDTNPVTVRGANFRPSERITLVASSTERGSSTVSRETKVVRSGVRGGFTAVLPTVEFNECGHFSVTASDAAGERATYKIVPKCGALLS